MFSRRAAVLCSALSVVISAQAADPITFREISIYVRTGQTGQNIINETARRKLLAPLTAYEEGDLRLTGASTSLIEALRTPSLLATPEEVEAYNARHMPKAAPAPAAPEPAPLPPPMRNPFPAGLEAAKKAAPRVMQLADAYPLGELQKASDRALSERKPLGFILVRGSLFGTTDAFSPRFATSGPALVHYYEAFKDSMILVFVRHEMEMKKVPAAVAAGLAGADQGGFEPRMVVTDATANEMITMIPMGGLKATGLQRDAIFEAGASKVYQWLTTHPTASAQLPAGR